VSVDEPLISINRGNEIVAHIWPLAIMRLIADRARYAGSAADGFVRGGPRRPDGSRRPSERYGGLANDDPSGSSARRIDLLAELHERLPRNGLAAGVIKTISRGQQTICRSFRSVTAWPRG
jgi:hypothetical protein